MKKNHPTASKKPAPSPLERKLTAFGKALQAIQDQFQIDLVAQPRMSQSGQGVWGIAAVIAAVPRQPQPPQQ